MKKMVLVILLLSLMTVQCIAGDRQAIIDLIERILPGRSHEFVIKYTDRQNGKDCYSFESSGHKIVLSGNNNNSIAVALNVYLRAYCHTSLSWNEEHPAAPNVLPLVGEARTGISPYQYRYYLNYCTFSYSMAFWDWKRWEKEIDWMALHGINLPLAIVGQEAVWQNTLRQYHYTDSEIKTFICGPSFNAWWLMGNLEAWGGPVPQSWIDGQAKLQQKIVKRMRALDMEPVLQGFYGMVPNSLAEKFPSAGIHDPGKWLGFKRPAMLLPTDPLFAKMAKAYYTEQSKLYGTARYFQGDPFHEGGLSEGVNMKAAGSAIYRSMNEQQPGAVWVLQSWQNNPSQEMLSGVPKGKALVANIMAEAKPQWGGKVKYWAERKDGFSGHDWIWSEIPNFGGRTGMTAKLDSTVTDVFEALHHPIGRQSMKGIGATPEGIGQDEIIYDLIYDLGWAAEKINLDDWLKKYAESRYGRSDDNILKALQVLRRTVYNSKYGKHDPPIESIICARPGWNRSSASTWGTGELDYDPAELINAWELFKKASSFFKNSDAYRYDLVNLTRQVLSNYARSLYRQMQEAYESKNISLFRSLSESFLSLIADQDRLLSTRKEFMLGPWLAMARNKGKYPAEKNFYEWNARTLITTWTHELNDVNDYSCREWSGLLKDYYLHRWQMFVAYSLSVMQGGPVIKPDYFLFEKQWTYAKDTYPVLAKEKELTVVEAVSKKYAGMFMQHSSALSWQGRIGIKEDRSEIYWAGSSVKTSFKGAGIAATLKDEKGLNYYLIILDEKPVKKIRLDTAKRSYSLVDHLSAGIHTLELFKCTQWDKGKTFFYGFNFQPDSKTNAVIETGNRKIEFYGNSITCGSAVEDSNGHNSGESKYENNYLSYASITARHYHSAYSCIARSGIGLMVSWYPLVMPEMYDRLDPSDPESKWDFSLFVPDIVVVNLLQNDSWILKLPANDQFKEKFGSTPPAEDFIVTAYRKFIRSIRNKYPSANIICVLGNMDAVAVGSPWPGYISRAVTSMNDHKVFTHFFSYKQTPGHPDIKEQQDMAASLVRFIDAHIRW